MPLSHIKERLKEYKKELERLVDEIIQNKMQQYNIPAEEEFQSLQKRIAELEQEKERYQKREVFQKQWEEAPSVPTLHFEQAPCKSCSRPQYRLGYCLYHFEQHFLGE